jgi:hypothetical protein
VWCWISERAAKGSRETEATPEAETRASASVLSCLPRSGLVQLSMVFPECTELSSVSPECGVPDWGAISRRRGAGLREKGPCAFA